MELSPRKKAVLAAIIKAYIETGEPVGSRVLTELIENAPSPATLRNEMSELCGLGLLEQPHTSAGRVPTDSGLSLYVRSLMERKEIPASAKQAIDRRFDSLLCNPEDVPEAAAHILSDLTGLPVIVSCAAARAVTVKKIEQIPVNRRLTAVLMVLSDGQTRNRIVHHSRDFESGRLHMLRKICDESIRGTPVRELTRPYIQTVAARAGINALDILPMISVIFEMAETADEERAALVGQTRLYNICAGERKARRILSLVESKHPFLSVFDSAGEGACVIFGEDTGFEELRGVTLTACRFAGEQFSGVLAALGPRRIPYEQVMPSVEYLAHRLEQKLYATLKDMEE